MKLEAIQICGERQDKEEQERLKKIKEKEQNLGKDDNYSYDISSSDSEKKEEEKKKGYLLNVVDLEEIEESWSSDTQSDQNSNQVSSINDDIESPAHNMSLKKGKTIIMDPASEDASPASKLNPSKQTTEKKIKDLDKLDGHKAVSGLLDKNKLIENMNKNDRRNSQMTIQGKQLIERLRAGL